MTDLFQPILDQIGRLRARVDKMPVVRWGTVTQSAPLLVQLDGDINTVTPQTVVQPIPVGARVVCVEQHRRVIIIAVVEAKLPSLRTVSLSVIETITATSWAPLPTPISVSLTLTAPAIVQVSLGGWLAASAGDTRAGVALSGATVQDAVTVDSVADSWGATLYKATGGSSTEQQSFTRLYQCNAGTTVFTVQAYQTGGGTHQVNYPVLQVVPIRHN